MGLYYHGARYYAPWLGRWTAADPAGLVDGLNLYRYSRDNPINFSDPGGTQSNPPKATNEEFHSSASNKQIGSLDDVQLHRHIKGLSAVERRDLIAGATGKFKLRAQQTATRGGFEVAEAEAPKPQGDSEGDAKAESEEPPAERSQGGTELDPRNLQIGPSGVRLAADVPRARYQNPVARDLASQGLLKLAEIAEAGHGCALCHISKDHPSMAAADASVDLEHYNSVAVSMATARDVAMLELATAGLGSALAPAPELVTIYRGTSLTSELRIAEEAGVVLSDAGRIAYMEARGAGAAVEAATLAAQEASMAAHAVQLEAWGGLGHYVEAHGAFGTEISAFGARSLVSWTTDASVAARFAGAEGRVFPATVPRASLLPQTLEGAAESEVLIAHLLRVGAP